MCARIALSVLATMGAWPVVVFGQASAFAPGGQELIALNLAGSQTGTFTQGIQLPSGARVDPLIGAMEVVLKDGVPMLRATEHSEFLITLPKGLVLPTNFTIEVDVVVRDGGPEPDLTLEGTRSINQGSASAHLRMSMDGTFGVVQIVGGNTNIPEVPMPDEVRVTLPKTLTRVGVSIEGGTIRFYINGVEILPDPEKPALKVQAQFARGEVLRVTLGGVTDAEPVYLARLRVATGATATVATALPAAMPIGTATITPLAPAIAAKVGPQGDASVSWSAISGATNYFVVRWKVDDANCCKNFSPPTGMNRLDWQDGVLPMAGTYAYRVYATTPNGISVGETTVAYQPVTAPVPGSGINRTAATKSSAPAARTIDLSAITALGGFGSVPPRSIALTALSAVGPFQSITARSIALTAIQATGALKVSTRTTSTLPTAPAPRTIALSDLVAAGVVGAVSPKTITLTAISGQGGAVLLSPRTISLPGLTAAGTTRIP